MRYSEAMGRGVLEAAHEGRVVVFNTGAYQYVDEATNKWRKETLTNWLDSAPDIKYTVRYLLRGQTAFIFEDPFYMKLFIIYFGIQFEWDKDALPELYGS
jgi:hypothetical protein